jgi:hypothetical protein
VNNCVVRLVPTSVDGGMRNGARVFQARETSFARYRGFRPGRFFRFRDVAREPLRASLAIGLVLISVGVGICNTVEVTYARNARLLAAKFPTGRFVASCVSGDFPICTCVVHRTPIRVGVGTRGSVCVSHAGRSVCSLLRLQPCRIFAARECGSRSFLVRNYVAYQVLAGVGIGILNGARVAHT